jgi:hypothetical protein
MMGPGALPLVGTKILSSLFHVFSLLVPKLWLFLLVPKLQIGNLLCPDPKEDRQEKQALLTILASSCKYPL